MTKNTNNNNNHGIDDNKEAQAKEEEQEEAQAKQEQHKAFIAVYFLFRFVLFCSVKLSMKRERAEHSREETERKIVNMLAK